MSIRLSFGQSQRQEQKQIMTQRLIQSMELLQLPLQQLEERVETELQTNPVLEPLDSDSRNDVYDVPSGKEQEPARPHDSENSQDEFRTANDFAETYADTLDEAPIRSQNWLEEAQQRHQDVIDNAMSRGETLEEHLRAQLDWFELAPEERNLCEIIVENLDRFGYLSVPLEELCNRTEGSSLDDWRKALAVIQSMDPPGIGARTIPESLLLQLPADVPNRDFVRLLIQRHFDDILHNRIPLIMRETGRSVSQIEEGIAEIRKLNPRPGAEFDDQTSQAVVPDVFVEKGDDGTWIVDVNDGNLIRLGINSEYAAMLKEKGMDKDAKEYLRRNIGQARWLIDALKQRKLTLLRVAKAIVRHQIDFFEIGPEKLRPLKMQQIADELGIHIATVSRACGDKWLQGPRGIYPLKSFFSGAVKTDFTLDDVTSGAVKTKIEELIDAEDKTNPLSDEEIVGKLKEGGIDISRRTVAKYRDALQIPSSRQRRKFGSP